MSYISWDDWDMYSSRIRDLLKQRTITERDMAHIQDLMREASGLADEMRERAIEIEADLGFLEEELKEWLEDEDRSIQEPINRPEWYETDLWGKPTRRVRK